MEKLRQLTKLEEAALTYAYYNGINHYEQIFDLCRTTKATTDTKPRIVSTWKNSDPVQKFLKELQLKDEERIRAKANLLLGKGKEEKNQEGEFYDRKVNFTNVTEFLQFANDKANLINDDKERREYLKIIADLMRFKEQGNNKETEIQRFYTQIHCKDCELYKKALK